MHLGYIGKSIVDGTVLTGELRRFNKAFLLFSSVLAVKITLQNSRVVGTEVLFSPDISISSFSY